MKWTGDKFREAVRERFGALLAGGNISRRAALKRAYSETTAEYDSALAKVDAKVAAIARNLRATAAIAVDKAKAALVIAPAQAAARRPDPPAPHAAAPARLAESKSAEIISSYEAGLYIPGSRSQSITEEFPMSAATAGWRASLDRPPPQYAPDTMDVSGDGLARAFEEQERRRKNGESIS